MQKYLIIKILILITVIRSIRSYDILDYAGDINVLAAVKLTKSNEPTNFVRVQKGYVITQTSPARYQSELKSFAFECIFRFDDAVANTKKNAFNFFSLDDPKNTQNHFKIGINGNNRLKFEIISDKFNNTITRETILPNQWNKLTVFYKNGELEYWLNCGSYKKFSFYTPNDLKTYFFDNDTPIFRFSVGLFEVSDNRTLLDIGGNFDIKRMKFYGGYLRPYENDCTDIP